MCQLFLYFITENLDQNVYNGKGLVKLMQRVKIAHSFLQSVSNQFQVIILNLPM